MDKKGQIIAVDFLFALMLVALALGYTFRIAEANNYSLKEEEFYMDLQRIGTASSELLVSSPDFTCEITMGTAQYFPNCITETKLSAPTLQEIKDRLGIPAQYKFEITKGTPPVHIAGDTLAGPVPDSILNVYSEERNVILGSPASISGIASANSEKITLKVWKA
jgi:hypothetical protein